MNGYDTRQVVSDREWGIAYVVNNIHRGNNTKMCQIIDLLKISSQSKQDIIDKCNITRFGDYTQWSKSHGRVKLIVEDNGVWNINPELHDHI